MHISLDIPILCQSTLWSPHQSASHSLSSQLLALAFLEQDLSLPRSKSLLLFPVVDCLTDSLETQPLETITSMHPVGFFHIMKPIK